MAAATTRAITPTHSGPFSANSVAPDTPTSISSGTRVGPDAPKDIGFPNTQSSLTPGLTSTAAAIRASLSPKSPRRGLSPAYTPQPLTGAAAMADDKKGREEKDREGDRQVSPNPAATAISSLLAGSAPGMSRPKDAPQEAITVSEPLAKIAKSIQIPEPGTNEQMETSPVSISSLGSVDGTTAPTVTAADTITAPPVNPPAAPVDNTQPNASSEAANANSGDNRALTFPPPPEHDPRINAPTRNMSLPMPGAQGSPRSPSTKRHKCPYCSTDFTRHHNLKSHLLTHSQEKPYECPTCQARFRRLHDLKRHTKLHTGERPHTCPKCGRRFARGDALARHNKGQGGCAGRRSSFGVDEDGEIRGEAMDGLEYSHTETAEPDRMDEDDPNGERRRVSEPSKHHDPTAQYSPHSSTYPPVGPRMVGGSGSRGMYPPGTGTPSRDQTTTLSPKAPTSSLSTVHLPPNQFAHGGMTESPKPLSPGASDQQHRMSISEATNPPGARPLSQQPFGRGAGRGSSPIGLPPPQLPSLSGLPNDRRLSQTGNGAGPSSLYQQQNASGGSNPSSMSSHSQPSGGSSRDVLGNRENELWNYIREVEGRMSGMQREHDDRVTRLQTDYEGRVNRLQEEVNSLKAQLQLQQSR